MAKSKLKELQEEFEAYKKANDDNVDDLFVVIDNQTTELIELESRLKEFMDSNHIMVNKLVDLSNKSFWTRLKYLFSGRGVDLTGGYMNG